MSREKGSRAGVLPVRNGAITRREYLDAALAARHLCMRELLKIAVPGRWQSAEILENLCQHYGHRRLLLPEFSTAVLFPGIDETPITMSRLPLGEWSAPTTDQAMLAKLARLLDPATILEVGSFRGYTARLLAENTSPGCTIHALDINPEHGEAYRNTPLSTRITRHFEPLADPLPASLRGLRFDFVFIDADHQFNGVERDTAAVLPALADDGLLVWHDYADWGWMSTWNRVPEFLYNLSNEIPILSIPGTRLAVHRRGWAAEDVHRAIADWERQASQSHWETGTIRTE
jgi:SAM-dependent methyltransferase